MNEHPITSDGSSSILVEIHKPAASFVPNVIYKCDKCSYCTRYKGTLRRHDLYRHQADIRPFSCEFCDKRWKSKSDLLAHLDTHGKTYHKCGYCDERFLSKSWVKTHIEKKHLNVKKIYACHICAEATFTKAGNLVRHCSKQHQFRLPDGQARTKFVLRDDGCYIIDIKPHNLLEID